MDISVLKVFIPFLITFVSVLVKLLYWAIIIKILMSWVAVGRTQFGVIIEQIVHPILKPFRWARIGMFDLSPIVALLLLDFLSRFLINFLVKLS